MKNCLVTRPGLYQFLHVRSSSSSSCTSNVSCPEHTTEIQFYLNILLYALIPVDLTLAAVFYLQNSTDSNYNITMARNGLIDY